MIFTLIIVVFRELAVTSMRLVVSTGEGIVIAANSLGKLKTVSQIVAISTVFLEPVVQLIARWIGELVVGEKLVWRTDIIPLTWLTILFSLVMTVWSGINYIKSYWKFLDPQK
jgi:CDP-diacylglycerol--glycerol-3-phosphate 3-phosphatidyltransferase